MQDAPTHNAALVRHAVESLAAFGDELSREDATLALAYWRHFAEMTTVEVALVLHQFEPVKHLPEHDGYKIGRGGAR